MTDKEIIRAEIESYIDTLERNSGLTGHFGDAQMGLCEKLLTFIDSMPEEPENDDLKEEIKNFLDQTGAPYYWAGEEEQLEWVEIIARHFANWQKKQLMKSGVNGVVHHFGDDEIASIHYYDPKGIPMSYFVSSEDLKAGDNVKLITIKEG